MRLGRCPACSSVNVRARKKGLPAHEKKLACNDCRATWSGVREVHPPTLGKAA